MPWLWATPSTTMLVEVPINEQVPPRIVANDSGISIRDGATFTECASRITTGVRMTTIGVLLMNADSTRQNSIITNSACAGDFHGTRAMNWPSASIMPVRSSAPDRTKRAPTVKGAGLLNTFSTSDVLRMPSTSNSAAPHSASTSGALTSRTMPKKTTATSASTMTTWIVSQLTLPLLQILALMPGGGRDTSVRDSTLRSLGAGLHSWPRWPTSGTKRANRNTSRDGRCGQGVNAG
jgi:hypothetical protein